MNSIEFLDSKGPNLDEYNCIITFGFYNKEFKSDICLHPFLDSNTNFYVRYECGTEEGVSALLLIKQEENKKEKIPSLENFLNEIDSSYICSETNISQYDLDEIYANMEDKKSILIFGDDVLLNKRSKQILKILQMLDIDVAFLSFDLKKLAFLKKQNNNSLDSIPILPSNDGCIAYLNLNSGDENILKCSNQFTKVWKIEDGNKLEISFDNLKFNAICKRDNEFGGVVSILTLTKKIFCEYRYKKITLRRCNDGQNNN